MERLSSYGELKEMRLALSELHVVAADAPRELLTCQKIVRVERRREAEHDGNHADTLALGERVEVDDAHQVVLRVRDEPVALRLEPADVLRVLQRRLRASDLVQALGQRQQRPVERART